jgi:hypothetical protein
VHGWGRDSWERMLEREIESKSAVPCEAES